MYCPECSDEMEKVEESSSNFFLVFTTRTYYYEYYKCPACGYRTEKECVAIRSLTGASDYDKDED